MAVHFHPHRYISMVGPSRDRGNDLAERSMTTAELYRESGKERAGSFRLHPCAFGRWQSILSPIARLVSVCLVPAEHKWQRLPPPRVFLSTLPPSTYSLYCRALELWNFSRTIKTKDKISIEVMYYQHIFSLFLIVIGMAFAAPSPHIGMINNDDIRDIGAVYSQAEFSSAPTFLLMDKQSPRYFPLYVISSLLHRSHWRVVATTTTSCQSWSASSPSSATFGRYVFDTWLRSVVRTNNQKNKDCGGSMSDEEAAFTVGCGDVHKLPLPLTGTYGSYKCQHVHLNTYEPSSTVRVETTPHGPNNDVLGQVLTRIIFDDVNHSLTFHSKPCFRRLIYRPHCNYTAFGSVILTTMVTSIYCWRWFIYLGPVLHKLDDSHIC